MAKLNEKQKIFCEEFLVDLNGTQAAIRAGYSKKTARSIASENLAKPDIQEYIAKLKNERCNKLKYNQEELLKDLLEVKNRCMQASPVLLPFGEQLKDKDGNNVWKFDSQGANKALDMIAKHIGFYEKDNNQKNNTPIEVKFI